MKETQWKTLKNKEHEENCMENDGKLGKADGKLKKKWTTNARPGKL